MINASSIEPGLATLLWYHLNKILIFNKISRFIVPILISSCELVYRFQNIIGTKK